MMVPVLVASLIRWFAAQGWLEPVVASSEPMP